MQERYDLILKIGDKSLKFRKWKVKDKKKFIGAEDNITRQAALVYDCLEDKTVALSDDEHRYALMIIRDASLPEKINFDFTCSDCNKEFSYMCNLKEVIKPVYGKYGEITAGSHIFKMGPLANRSYYSEKMTSTKNKEEKYLIDFILHVQEYNDGNYTFDELFGIIEELDIDVYEEIFEQWEEMRFKINPDHPVKCPHCSFEELYEFDVLPGFFPESWNIE